MKQKLTNTPQILVVILLGWAFLFGAYTRISVVTAVDFPINDGGYFYTMVEDLLANRFTLPMVTTYNNLDIPFAYPPFALYLAAVISWAGMSLLEVFRWLPLIFSLATIPAFYWLGRIILRNNILAALATVIFTLLPRSFEWLIMGGGLTRAPATLFFILFAGYMLLVFRDRNKKAILLAILFGGLILVTHPERSLHAAVSGLFIWVYFDRSRQGITRAGIIGIGVLAISALWWGPVVVNWGLDPIIRAMSAGGNRLLFWSPMVLLNFTDETIPLAALFSAVGFIYALSRREWFLPFWVALTFIADPRSAPHIIPVLASPLVALAIRKVFFAALFNGNIFSWENFLKQGIGKTALGWILVLTIVNAQITAASLTGTYSLDEGDQTAAGWVNNNTPADSSILVYSSNENPALSPVLEWFPTLSQRRNLSTFQGREWLGGDVGYVVYWELREGYQECLTRDSACLVSWLDESASDIDYIYFSLGPEHHNNSLAESLRHSSGFKMVYQADSVVIFERLQ